MNKPSAAQWLTSLQQLMPRGLVYRRLRDQLMTHLLGAAADSLHQAQCDLVESLEANINPCTADNQRQNWLNTTGIYGDNCIGDIDECNAMLGTLSGGSIDAEGMEEAFYRGLLASHGIRPQDITFSYGGNSAQCGEAECGESEMGDGSDVFDWAVTLRDPDFYGGLVEEEAECGGSECGDYLGDCYLPWFECLLIKNKPSHTHLTVLYLQPVLPLFIHNSVAA